VSDILEFILNEILYPNFDENFVYVFILTFGLSYLIYKLQNDIFKKKPLLTLEEMESIKVNDTDGMDDREQKYDIYKFIQKNRHKSIWGNYISFCFGCLSKYSNIVNEIDIRNKLKLKHEISFHNWFSVQSYVFFVIAAWFYPITLAILNAILTHKESTHNLFRLNFADEFWKWPILLIVIISSLLSTYIITEIYNKPNTVTENNIRLTRNLTSKSIPILLAIMSSILIISELIFKGYFNSIIISLNAIFAIARTLITNKTKNIKYIGVISSICVVGHLTYSLEKTVTEILIYTSIASIIVYIFAVIYTQRIKNQKIEENIMFIVTLFSLMLIAFYTTVIYFLQNSTSLDNQFSFIPVFLGILPVINSILDWISFNITRHIAYNVINEEFDLRSIMFYFFLDLVIAFFLAILTLGTTLFVIFLIGQILGQPIFDIHQLVKLMRAESSYKQYIWIHFMIFSTILPSIIHILFLVFSPFLVLLSKLNEESLKEFHHNISARSNFLALKIMGTGFCLLFTMFLLHWGINANSDWAAKLMWDTANFFLNTFNLFIKIT